MNWLTDPSPNHLPSFSSPPFQTLSVVSLSDGRLRSIQRRLFWNSLFNDMFKLFPQGPRFLHRQSLIFQIIYWLQQSTNKVFSMFIIFMWSWTILKWTHSSVFCFSFFLLKIRDKIQCHKTLMIPAGTKLYHIMFLNNYFWLLLGKYFYVGCNTQKKIFLISTVSFSPGHIREKKELLFVSREKSNQEMRSLMSCRLKYSAIPKCWPWSGQGVRRVINNCSTSTWTG